MIHDKRKRTGLNAFFSLHPLLLLSFLLEFTSFLCVFGLDVLIYCLSRTRSFVGTTQHFKFRLLFLDEYQWYFHGVSNSRPFVPKSATITRLPLRLLLLLMNATEVNLN